MNQLTAMLAEQHHQDALRWAAQHRLAMQAQQARGRRHEVALAWVGEQFIAWGWRLRARYGKLEDARTPVLGR